MTVIAMSRTEIDRMSVLQDLAANRIKVTEAARLMGLGRRQVFRLSKAFARHGPEALVSRRRGRPSNRSYPSAWRTEVLGIVRERYLTSARRRRRRSWRSCTAFTLGARRCGNG